jgi:hypothetical protein
MNARRQNDTNRNCFQKEKTTGRRRSRERNTGSMSRQVVVVFAYGALGWDHARICAGAAPFASGRTPWRSSGTWNPGALAEPVPIRCLWKKARERVVAALICIITLCCALLCSATNDDATATTFPVWVPASASVRFPCVRDAHRVSLCRPAGGVEPSISGTCCQDKSVCRSTWPAGTRPGSTGGDANAGPKSIFLPPGRTADKDGHHAGRPAGAPNPSHNA